MNRDSHIGSTLILQSSFLWNLEFFLQNIVDRCLIRKKTNSGITQQLYKQLIPSMFKQRFHMQTFIMLLDFSFQQRTSLKEKLCKISEKAKWLIFLSWHQILNIKHFAFSLILQSFSFKEVRRLILAPSQRKLRGYIEFWKFDVTIKKKFKFV